VSSNSFNQTIKNLAVDDCSSYSNVLFNYTIVDEDNQNKLNETVLEIDLTIYDDDKTYKILNYSNQINNTNPVKICSNIDLSDSVFAVDSVVKYTRSSDYVTEYYHIQGFQMTGSNTPQNTTLYLLETSSSTDFQITVKDTNLALVEGAIVYVNRQYVSEGVFKTVEVPKTDSNGQTVVHLVEKDVVYNFVVVKGGEVLGTFNHIIAFCENPITGECTLSLTATGRNVESFDYDEYLNMVFNSDFNESLREYRLSFTTLDGVSRNVEVEGILMDMLGNTTACSDSIDSSSGTLICTIPPSLGNTSVIINIYVDGSLVGQDHVNFGKDMDIGYRGTFLAFFLVLSIALMMIESKIAIVIGVIVGFISSILLSLIEGGILGVASMIVWLVIAGGVLIYKLNKEGT